MYKIIVLLLLAIPLISTSCSEDSENTCDRDCNEWEYCDTGIEKCRVNKGFCNEESDCIGSSDICKENKCITPVYCEDWEQLNQETNTCFLKEGSCYTSENCDPDSVCEMNTHECKENLKVTWSTNCPSYLGASAECSTVKLPLKYDDPFGKTIDIFVFRHKSKSANVKGQIWFLQGGPGGSGSIFSKYYFDTYLSKYPDYDFYSLDHRGVANSSRLTCLKEDTLTTLISFQNCVSELYEKLGDDIQEYSTTNSAKDLGYLLDVLKEDNKKRFVYGVSYGTYWAERYLTIHPEQADGVILDSICTLGNCHIDDYSYWVDVVGKQFMDVCANDTTCKAKMESINPTGTKEAMLTVLNKMDTTPCDFGYGPFDKDYLRVILGGMLRDWYARRMIPPVLYRLNRCEAKDKTALKTLVSKMYGAKKYVTEAQMDNNNVLYYNIVFSELWLGRTEAEITEVYDNSLFNTGNGLDMFKMKDRNIWNEYTDEYIAQTKPETNTPVLMMNGTLDPQTALEIALPSKEFLNKENHYFITFPETPHGVTSTSITNEMLSNHFGGTTCGEKIMFEFIKNPLQKPSEACLSDIALLSWGDTGMNRGMAYQFMNTTDMWDGDQTGKKSLEDSKFSKAITESLERTRRTYINSPEFIKLMKRIK